MKVLKMIIKGYSILKKINIIYKHNNLILVLACLIVKFSYFNFIKKYMSILLNKKRMMIQY